MLHTDPAKGDLTTPRSRKRHYDALILSFSILFHNDFKARARGKAAKPLIFPCVFCLVEKLLDTKEKGRENMNIFHNESDIFGDYRSEDLQNLLHEFLSQACKIRERLGKQAHLLDKYLSYLLESSNHQLAYNAASDGFEYGSMLHLMCAGILRGESQDADPFFLQAKAYIEAHPLPFLERPTQIAFYCVSLAGPFVKGSCQSYFQQLSVEAGTILDIFDLNDLYEKICVILDGTEDMDKLNLLFRKRFLIAPAMSVFLQGMTNQLLYALTLRDSETSKQVFQLLLADPKLSPEKE